MLGPNNVPTETTRVRNEYEEKRQRYEKII